MPPPAPVITQTLPASRPPSATLEHPLALVARDDLVEEALLGARVVEVVVDDLVAEKPARDLATLELPGRVAERVREAGHVRRVGVPLEGRPELEPFLDPVQPRRE